MAKITKEEVIKLAKNSRIHLEESEIPTVINELEAVLSYAERVVELSAEASKPSLKNVNVLRPDLALSSDPRPILAQAPEENEGYFVVLPILDK